MRRFDTVVLLVLLASPALACGAPIPDVDDGVRVRRGGDLVSGRAQVTVRDTLPGDVMAAGRDVLFTGVAGGDLLLAGGRHRVGGSTAGSVRAAGSDIRIGGEIGRNVTAAGSRVVLERRARVVGNSYLVGRSVRVDGTAGGLVRIAAQEVVLTGRITGDVLVEASRLRIGPEAVIEGDLRYRLRRGEEPAIEAGARIDGEVYPLSPRPRIPVRATLRILALVGFLVAGAVLVALLPGLSQAAQARVGARPLSAFATGILLLLLVPVLLALLAVTVIGIPLALVAAALFGVTVYLAPVVSALWVGRLLLRGSTYPERPELVGAFLLGGVLLGVLGLVPWVGPAVLALATIFGLGAFAVGLWEGAVVVESGRV
jgi:cytoskeletal protein CcmA (bactofilin family)